mgnify:CR=1 FL=1
MSVTFQTVHRSSWSDKGCSIPGGMTTAQGVGPTWNGMNFPRERGVIRCTLPLLLTWDSLYLHYTAIQENSKYPEKFFKKHWGAVQLETEPIGIAANTIESYFGRISMCFFLDTWDFIAGLGNLSVSCQVAQSVAEINSREREPFRMIQTPKRGARNLVLRIIWPYELKNCYLENGKMDYDVKF